MTAQHPTTITRSDYGTPLPRGQYRWVVRWWCRTCTTYVQEVHYGSRWSVETALRRYPECGCCVEKHEMASRLAYERTRQKRKAERKTAKMAARLRRGLGGER